MRLNAYSAPPMPLPALMSSPPVPSRYRFLAVFGALCLFAQPQIAAAQSDPRDFQLQPAPTPTGQGNVQGPVDEGAQIRPRPTPRPQPAATPTPRPTASAPTPTSPETRPAPAPGAFRERWGSARLRSDAGSAWPPVAGAASAADGSARLRPPGPAHCPGRSASAPVATGNRAGRSAPRRSGAERTGTTHQTRRGSGIGTAQADWT